MALGIDPQTLDTLTSLQRDYGDMVTMTRPNGRLACFINDAAEVRRILTRRHARYRKGPGFERVKMLLGNGLIVSDGDTWRRSRTMIQPAFTRQNVHRLLRVMQDCSERRGQHWAALARANETCNITSETSDFALELILVSIFGRDYETHILTQGENPFAFLSRDSTRDLSVVLKVRKLRELLTRIIDDRKGRGAGEEYDFLAMYLQARDKQGNPFTTEELLDELMTLIVAGFETSANTLNWAWYLLARHPDVERELLREIEQQVPEPGALTIEAVTAMTYTQQVLEETLRLYPPVWLFTRRADQDDDLEHYDIPAGTDIYLSPFILHRTERYWPEPERFDPTRFVIGDKPKKGPAVFPVLAGTAALPGRVFFIPRNENSPGDFVAAVSIAPDRHGGTGARARNQPARRQRYSLATCRAPLTDEAL